MSSGPESPAWGGRAPPQPGCIGPQELVLLQMALLWDRAWGWWPQLGPPPPQLGTSVSRICHPRIQV